MSYPKISIVTACYNMVDYIDHTIKSVVSQDYPNLEYIVVDGGSTDGTLDIIEKYRSKISRIISEPDDGQYHAIQKGMDLATGDILAWLNADDLYYPWTLSVVGEIFEKFGTVDWITGLPSYFNEKNQVTRISNTLASFPQEFIRNGWFQSKLGGCLQQESLFWRKSLWQKAGGLDLSYQLAADFKLWTQFAKYSDLVQVSVPLAGFKFRLDLQRSQSGRDSYENEVVRACENLHSPPFLWKLLAKQNLVMDCLCRLAIWKKSRVVAYSGSESQWLLKYIRRPISRTSFSGLLLENSLRS